MSTLRQVIALLAWLLLCYAAGGVGGLFTEMSVDTWYPSLTKPWWTPSGQTIAVVWNILYGLMGLSAWVVWRDGGFRGHGRALAVFLLQLALNVKWSALFFGLQRPGLAAVEVVILWFAILLTCGEFRKVSSAAGWLLVPYLTWVAFAAVLNVMIWWLN